MTIGAVASLFLVAVLAVLWVRSFVDKGDEVSFATADGWELSLISYRGGLVYDRELLHPRFTLQLGTTSAVRYASVVLTGLILPAWHWGRGRPPVGTGFCATCGYDLRATPTRCPECGTEPVAPPPVEAAPLVDYRAWVLGAFGLLCLAVGWVGQPVSPDIASDAFFFAIVCGAALAILILITTLDARGRRQKRMSARET